MASAEQVLSVCLRGKADRGKAKVQNLGDSSRKDRNEACSRELPNTETASFLGYGVKNPLKVNWSFAADGRFDE